MNNKIIDNIRNLTLYINYFSDQSHGQGCEVFQGNQSSASLRITNVVFKSNPDIRLLGKERTFRTYESYKRPIATLKKITALTHVITREGWVFTRDQWQDISPES